jgi:threonine/homoserine/homoserine lactone efflux protein
VNFSEWSQLALVCILGAMSPGPSLAVVLRNTVSGGRSQGILTGVGHGLGMLLYAIPAVFGLATLFQTLPYFYQIAQWLGAVFLMWLGTRMIRSGWTALQSARTGNVSEPAPSSGRQGFGEGFLIAFLNPKIAAWLLALFSQFVHPEASLAEQVVMVSTVGGVDLSWYCLVALLASSGRRIDFLKRHAPRIDLGMGLLLWGLALGVVFRALESA